MSKKQEF